MWWGMVLALFLMGGAGALGGVDCRWEGELALLGRPALEEAELELSAGLGSWEFSSLSSFADGLFSGQTFELQGYGWGYRLAVAGKCVLSRQGRVLKRLYRSLDEVCYDQLLWGPAGTHFRYFWLKGELPTLLGTFTGKAYHSANYPSDITWRYFPEVYTWNAGAGRWQPTGRVWAEVQKTAFIAAKVRLRALVEGQWRSRTEYSLRVSLAPEDRVEPFSLAGEARRYLDAKYPGGWELRTPIDPGLVKVYLWRRGISEYSLRFHSSSEWEEPEWELEISWAGRSGIGFEELELDWEGWRWCDAVGEFSLSFSQAGFAGLSLELSGFSLVSGLTAALGFSLTPASQRCSLAFDWLETAGRTTLHGGVAGQGGAITGLALYGLELSLRGVGWEWRVLWVFARPPSPRPSWYTKAGFKRLATTGDYEDGLISHRAWGYGPAGRSELAVSAYFADAAAFGLSRILIQASFPISKGFELGISFQSDDPATPGVAPALTLSWTLELGLDQGIAWNQL